MELREIARLCAASQMLDGEVAGLEPSGFAIDSRAIKAGDLFVAIPGEHVDGHRFVREIFEKGAIAALVVHHRLPFSNDLGALAGRLLFVDDTLSAFQRLAGRVVASWGGPIVGVTGSAGKTTMKDIIAHCLGGAGNTLKSLGNLNTGYGLPLTISRMIAKGARPADYEFVVLEMGMSSFGEIARLTDIAPPALGLVGNVGTAHLEFFGTRERIARAKAEMVEGIRSGGTAVLNADDPLVLGMRSLRDDLEIVTFAIDAQANIRATAIEEPDDLSGIHFQLHTPRGEARVSASLIGRHNVYNALAGAAVGHVFGLDPEQIASRLATVVPSKMRGELIRFPNGVTVIDDSYNSNPQALMQAVRAMPAPHEDATPEQTGFKRKIVVAGEMLELGSAAEELHRQCGREIAAANIDRLIGVRGLAKEMVQGAGDLIEALYFETPEEAAEFLSADSKPGDLILVKGSRGVRTERVIEKLRSFFEAPGVG